MVILAVTVCSLNRILLELFSENHGNTCLTQLFTCQCQLLQLFLSIKVTIKRLVCLLYFKRLVCILYFINIQMPRTITDVHFYEVIMNDTKDKQKACLKKV